MLVVLILVQLVYTFDQSFIELSRNNMRTLVLVAALCMVILLVSSSPIDSKRQLIIRPKQHDLFRRSAPVKGGTPGIKGYNPQPSLNLRKGEYMCGNKVCKLKPGEIPKGCNGVCQYHV